MLLSAPICSSDSLTCRRCEFASLSLPVLLANLLQALLYGPDGGLSHPVQAVFEEHIHNPNFEVSVQAVFEEHIHNPNFEVSVQRRQLAAGRCC